MRSPVVRYSLAATAALALAALALTPASAMASLPTVCLFRNLFGIECLGCGMTRALWSALHGDWTQALAYNRLVVVALPGMAALVVAGFIPARPR